MTYKVIIQPEAQQQLSEAFSWLAENKSGYAPAWRNSLLRAAKSLEEMPFRCALAPENPRFDLELRHLQFGKGKSSYRLIFTVERNEVHVLHVRHGHRKALEGAD